MLIKCKGDQRQDIIDIISEESDKMGIPIDVNETDNGIEIIDIFPFCVDEDVMFEDWCLEEAEDDACESPQEVFGIIKEKYPDIEIDGTIEIGDDNNRNFFYFHSASGSTEVDADYALISDQTAVPLSKCWCAILDDSGNGLYVTGFAFKKDFEAFIEATKDFCEENEVSFEEFITSDLLEDYFGEDFDEASEFPMPDDLTDFYSEAWEKYKQETED